MQMVVSKAGQNYPFVTYSGGTATFLEPLFRRGKTMPIPFTCPHCGTLTNVDDQYAGQSGPCASCGQTITVPDAAHGTSGPANRSSAGAAIAVLLGVIFVGFFLCAGGIMWFRMTVVPTAQMRAQRNQCNNSLKQIGLAMHNYHDVYRCFPAAVMTDEEGNPRRSWRVAILPFLQEGATYDQYDFNESWDGSNNQALEGDRPVAYECSVDAAAGPFDASCVMIVGEGTVGGEPNAGVEMQDITDGTANTIVAIEVSASGIHWMEPRDMTVDEAIAYITDPAASGRVHAHPGGVNAILADGSIHLIPSTSTSEELRAMMIRADDQLLEELLPPEGQPVSP